MDLAKKWRKLKVHPTSDRQVHDSRMVGDGAVLGCWLPSLWLGAADRGRLQEGHGETAERNH